MRHADLWRALDTLAAEKGLSVSGLARLAGLDPTSFNRSKRFGPNGPRWPGTESLSRVLVAAGIGLDAFATLVEGARVLPSEQAARPRTLPLLLFSRLGGREPTGDHRIETWMEAPVAAGGYLVRMDSARFEPALRENALLVLEPDAVARDNDRAIAFTGEQAIACVAASPAPLRLDTGLAMEGPCVLHRIAWIGL